MALSTLTRNARAQIQLINDLLDISRIISGKLSINPQPAELASLVQIGIDSIRPAARAKDIEIVVDLPKLPVQLSIDSDRMQQVLWNLLANAVKFTPEHGRIDIVMEDRGHQVRFLIKDTGQGIDARFLPFVFDRFRQEDGSTTRSQGGLGLGLAIARYLVELHGGSIDVHSEGRGKGTEFMVSLPRRSVAHVSPAAQEGSSVPRVDENQGLGGDLKNVKILLIDDSPDVRTLVSRILTRAGALVTAVDSAASGFEEFEKSRPDVVLSDIGLPHEDGTSLIRRLRQLEAEAQTTRVPAAALTAYAQESDTHKFLVAGFDSHIPKPVSATALLQCVHSLLDPTLAKRA
jgi:CheY-like chemotaxis protein/anti-sigma regulatory factor (Ser/Thr protein kinase)